MKTKYSYLMIVAAMTLTTSCSNDDAPSIPSNEFKIYASVDGVESRVNSEGSGDKFLPGDEIKVATSSNYWYNDDQDHGYKPIGDWISFVTTNGTIDGIAEFTSVNGNYPIFHKNGLLAYYSERELELDAVGRPIYTVCTDQSTETKLKEADFIISTPDFDNYDLGIAEARFTRETTKITITIDDYENFDASEIASMTPENAKLYHISEAANGRYRFIGRALDPIFNENRERVSIAIKPLVTFDEETGKLSFTAIIPHYSDAYFISQRVYHARYEVGETILTFNLAGFEYVVKAPEKIIFEANNHYIFSLKLIGKYATSIGNVSLGDWNRILGEKNVII